MKCLPWQKNTPKGMGLEALRVDGIMMEGCTWEGGRKRVERRGEVRRKEMYEGWGHNRPVESGEK